MLLSLDKTQSMIFPKPNREVFVPKFNQKVSYNSPKVILWHNMLAVCQQALIWKSNQMLHITYYC